MSSPTQQNGDHNWKPKLFGMFALRQPNREFAAPIFKTIQGAAKVFCPSPCNAEVGEEKRLREFTSLIGSR